MVNIVEEWEALEKYAGDMPGLYQLVENEGKIEVRVWIGNCGIKTEFEANDPKLMRVLDFCWKHCTKICGNIPDSAFFRP